MAYYRHTIMQIALRCTINCTRLYTHLTEMVNPVFEVHIIGKVGRSMGVLIAASKFGITKGYKSKFNRSELNSISVGYAHL